MSRNFKSDRQAALDEFEANDIGLSIATRRDDPMPQPRIKRELYDRNSALCIWIACGIFCAGVIGAVIIGYIP